MENVRHHFLHFLLGELLVARQLGAAVPRQRKEEPLRQRVHLADEGIDDAAAVFPFDPNQNEVPRIPFDKGRDVRVPSSCDEVALPVSWLGPRRDVGWALSAVNDRHLTLKALDAALRRRCPGAGLLHHSDRGSTYASEDYRQVLAQHGIVCSMSRRGNCYDNAAMESWNSTLKSELGERFDSAWDAKVKIFDYIEVFYNQQRMHSSIDYMSPAEFERAAIIQVAA
jgi:transposase InsO family protein